MATKITTTSEVKLPEMTLTFTQGLLGFEHLKKYSLSPYDKNNPFYWLRSLEDPDLQFIAIEPQYIVEDYVFDLSDEDVEELQITEPMAVVVLVIVCIPDDPTKMTANLLGPLIFNAKLGIGKQIILHNASYPLQYPLFPDGLPGTGSMALQNKSTDTV